MTQSSERSRLLALPYIQANQAQKHVTHNEALRALDAIVQLSVEGVAATPDLTPDEGDRWIVATGATEAFAGQDGAIAVRTDGAWAFHVPAEGWLAWDRATALLRVWTGSDWDQAGGAPETVDRIGIATGADDTNRLAVASEAVLVTHAGAGTQVKLNKATGGDTASLLFQTGWSGRVEIGTAGDDDLHVKTSADGVTWTEAMVLDAATGRARFPAGLDGLTDPAFGTEAPITAAYVASRGLDLMTNGTGLLGNGYNYPDAFTFDTALTPGMAGSNLYRGYYPGPVATTESFPVDPSATYRMSCAIHQESIAGDWSAHPNESRHQQLIGLILKDIDGLQINPLHHMRFRHGGVDSLTELAAPLAPGDTVVSLVDASGWNETVQTANRRGIIIFGYRNSGGFLYSDYSRIYLADLFDLTGVDKVANTITLKAPLPASMANPDDANGIWPAGTRLANTDSGGTYKYVASEGYVLPQDDTWYRATGYIGGTDLSGRNAATNFAPGTAAAQAMWLPNFSNRAGGYTTYADTGAQHGVRFAGLSFAPEPLAAGQRTADGSVDLKVPVADYALGTIGLAPAGRSLTEID
ncbi:DUF2793 domain-containing protein [uncultured Jannaschia sp.]|uniref:DUF2793 domain-containing protein n=1 Tax=uncultured Jannaschia sp. TaxID=293347 RepID=UPI0026190019|nr:DUF2793 domain-containing protein [uncultured Jannaschia sp.]